MTKAALDRLKPRPRSAAPVLTAACLALVAAVVATPLLAPRAPVPSALAGASKRPLAETRAAPAPVATAEAQPAFAIPEHALPLNEKIYEILAREDRDGEKETALHHPAPGGTAAPAPAPSDLALGEPTADGPAQAQVQVQALAQAPQAPATLSQAPMPPTRPIATVAAEASHLDAPARRPPEAFVGVWTTHASACSARSNAKGYLLAAIDDDGAWAGTTRCAFRGKRETTEGWAFDATCRSPRERWVAKVRLKAEGNRLTWSSQRGTQTYVRCEKRLLTAQAG